jgi:hypothetical protein
LPSTIAIRKLAVSSGFSSRRTVLGTAPSAKA